MEPPPRTRIEIAASGRPSCEVMFTPGSLPCIACATLETGITDTVLPPTEATEPVKSLRLIV